MSQKMYQCVLAPDGLTWHLVQEQAAPPSITRGGGYTTCALWCEFRRGYEQRRPTCVECLRAVEKDEARQAKKLASQKREPRRLGT